MKRFHMSKDGAARPCNAEHSCPLGSTAPHMEFESQAEATQWAEKILKEEFVGKELAGLRSGPVSVNPSGRLIFAPRNGVYEAHGSAKEAAYYRDTGRRAIFVPDSEETVAAKAAEAAAAQKAKEDAYPETAPEGAIYYVDQRGYLRMKDFFREAAILGVTPDDKHERWEDKKAGVSGYVGGRSVSQKIREFPYKPFTSKTEALAWREEQATKPKAPVGEVKQPTREELDKAVLDNPLNFGFEEAFAKRDEVSAHLREAEPKKLRSLFSKKPR